MKDEALNTLMRKIAAELSAADFPNLWRVRRNRREWWETLTTSNAWIDAHRDGQRLEFRASFPPEMERVYNAPSITVSATRTPEAIARDLLHRLIPDARAHFAKCHEATRKAKADRATHAALLHMLEPFTNWKRTDSGGTRTEWRSNRTRADVYTSFVSELRINSPSNEEVIKILKILKDERIIKMSYQDWLEELDKITYEELGLEPDDLPDAPTREYFENGLTPRAAFEMCAAEYWQEYDPQAGIDQSYYEIRTDEPETDASGQCFTDADPGL